MLSSVHLIGNLGADPEGRSTRGDTSVATFSLGTSRPKRDGEGKVMKDEATGYTMKDTEWHRITCFNGLAKIITAHATKGMLVAVRGRIHYSSYEKDGVTRYATEIIAEDVQFLSRAKPATAEQADAELDEGNPF